MNRIKENKALVVVVLTLSFAFYWYEWRPSKIKEGCTQYAVRVASLNLEEHREVFNFEYGLCLKKRGI